MQTIPRVFSQDSAKLPSTSVCPDEASVETGEITNIFLHSDFGDKSRLQSLKG
jgi:hypothetical protein